MDRVVQRWHCLSYAMPSWSMSPCRRICWVKVSGLVKIAFRLSMISLGTIREGVGLDLMGEIVWIV